MPFKLWPHQLEMLAEISQFQDIFVEKSREMGISWFVMAFELHQALFTDYFTVLNISRKESEVEDTGKTFHSLMGRIDFIYQRLPNWLKFQMRNPKLSFQVYKTHSIIKGESANKDAGRDTQYKMIFVDEAAHIDVFPEMWKGIRNSTDCLVINSTPPSDPADNKYFELKQIIERDQQKGAGFKKLKFHWSQHPNKDEDWFNKKTAAMTDEEISQELEIGYSSTKTRFSYPEFDTPIHVSDHKIYFNPKSKLYITFDFGLAATVMLFLQIDKDRRAFMIDEYEEKEKLPPEHYKNLLRILAKIGYQGALDDIIYYGDEAGNKRSQTTMTSVIQEYNMASKGLVRIKTRPIRFDEKARTCKKFLKDRVNEMPRFVISSNCTKFPTAVKACRFNKTGTDHVDNWATHKVNAWEYFVVHEFPLQKAGMVCIAPEEEYNKRNDQHSTLRNVIDTHRVKEEKNENKPAMHISDAWAYKR